MSVEEETEMAGGCVLGCLSMLAGWILVGVVVWLALGVLRGLGW